MTQSVIDIDPAKVDRLIEKNGSNPEALIGILQDIQKEWQYLPLPALRRISERLSIPADRVWAVATFYSAFTLEPKGRTHFMVCTGTACHVRGATEVVAALEDALMIKAGHTTPDGRFSIETAHCLGACAMGPVVVVSDEYHGHMSRNSVLELVDKYTDREGGNI
ncbi:MAG: NAD(P)H-dependent oxidoreductase subunit E [bacterium]